MTTKTLTGFYASTYNLAAPITTLSITATAYLGGGLLGAPVAFSIVNDGGIRGDAYGIELAGAGSIINRGAIFAGGASGDGINLRAGGGVVNGVGGQIGGAIGIYDFSGPASVTNDGVIAGSSFGVEIYGGIGTVTNQGAIQGGAVSYGRGVLLFHAGLVINGAETNTTASIEGEIGIQMYNAAGTVDNFGSILGSAGVDLIDGGVVNNGDAVDTSARIGGLNSIACEFGAGTVNNFGVIGYAGAYEAVFFQTGGRVVNGAATDTGALIEGRDAVVIDSNGTAGITGTIVNFGTLRGGLIQGSGIDLGVGGSVTNGSAGDTTALIDGGRAISSINGGLGGGPVTLTNFGTISGSPSALGFGVELEDGGRVINGTTADTAAVIEGGAFGVMLKYVAGPVTNFGTILGAMVLGVGVYLPAGGVLTNGAATVTSAVIAGNIGAELGGASTAVNFGTIRGSGESTGRGAVMNGAASRLTNGTASDHAALISGLVGVDVGAGDTLTNFGTVVGTQGIAVRLLDPTARLNAEAGSAFNGQIQAGGGLVDFVGGVSKASGLVSAGMVMGAGTVSLGGGLSAFNAGATLTVAQVVVSGAATEVAIETTNLAYAGTWIQNAGTLLADSTFRINFSGAGDSFAGTLAGAGAVAFIGGSDTLKSTSLTIAKVIINGAAVTLTGAIANAAAITATTANLVVSGAGVTLSGGGSLNFTNHAANQIRGATAGATLTNVDNRITGAGDLGGGQMVLVNQAGGIIIGNLTTALIIDTGAATITNAGVIENVGAGGTNIKGAIHNTGTLIVTDGALTVAGAVTGAGTVRIAGGAADFAGTMSENVSFTGGVGSLELAHSSGYGGTITGFSKTGITLLDLLDIAFASGTTKATYSGTTTSGVLTVTDGTHTAHIHLTGDYTASTFVVANDGHGGTLVHDPAKAAAVGFAAAMAGFGAGTGPSGAAAAAAPRLAPPVVALPTERQAN